MTVPDVTAIKESSWCVDIKDPFNRVLTGVEVVNQSIDFLLFTPVGSIPGQPEKGSRIDEILDLPVIEAVPLVVKEIHRVIPRWIPGIELVSVKTAIEKAGLNVRIEWKFSGNSEVQEKEVTFDTESS